MKPKTFIITVTVRSKTGKRPRVKTLGGDTVFVWLEDGMEGRWKVAERRPKRKPRVQ